MGPGWNSSAGCVKLLWSQAGAMHHDLGCSRDGACWYRGKVRGGGVLRARKGRKTLRGGDESKGGRDLRQWMAEVPWRGGGTGEGKFRVT